jgi:hypothetical protein
VGIDLGVTNLAAIASNREGFVSRLVNGRPFKAWNQWYNKRVKELRNKLLQRVYWNYLELRHATLHFGP